MSREYEAQLAIHQARFELMWEITYIHIINKMCGRRSSHDIGTASSLCNPERSEWFHLIRRCNLSTFHRREGRCIGKDTRRTLTPFACLLARLLGRDDGNIYLHSHKHTPHKDIQVQTKESEPKCGIRVVKEKKRQRGSLSNDLRRRAFALGRAATTATTTAETLPDLDRFRTCNPNTSPQRNSTSTLRRSRRDNPYQHLILPFSGCLVVAVRRPVVGGSGGGGAA